jgi:hypothetical protein
MTRTATKTLSARQQKALAALLVNPTIEAAAASVEIHPRTVKRWLSEDELFVEEYKKLRQHAVDNAICSLQAVMSEAVETLRKNLKAKNPSIQVRAAIALLEQGFKAAEAHDLEQRISELERSSREGWSGSW